MSWTGVITNAGANLLSSFAEGTTIDIDNIETGTSYKSTTTEMKAMTALAAKVTGGDGIVQSVRFNEGIATFRLRVGPFGGSSSYTMKEIGLFVNATSGGSTQRIMLAYFCDASGINIPLEENFPDFAYILTANLSVGNDVTMTLTVDGSSYIAHSEFEEALSDVEAEIAAKVSIAQSSADSGKIFIVGGSGNLELKDGVMTGATDSANGKKGFVPAPTIAQKEKFLKGDGTWDNVPDTTYSAGDGLELDSTTFKLVASGASSGSYGPSADVSGTEGTTMNVPYLSVDQYGRILSISNKVYTSKDTTYTAGTGLALSGGAFSLKTSGATAGNYGPSAAVSGTDGTTMNVPYITVDAYGRITSISNKVYTSKNTTYSAGTGLSLSSGKFSLGTSGATAGKYGPSANVTGTDGTTMSVPYITVDAYGRITSISNKTYTSKNTNTTYSAGNGLSLSGTTFSMSGSYTGNFTATKVYNAVWNDVAECRKAETVEPGYCVTETESGIMKKTTERLMPGCRLTSDTFGSCMGETDEAKTPIAIAGRVLVYPTGDRSRYHLGDAVCSAPDGKIDVMTREEIREYPERIVGTVSEIPTYEEWYAGDREIPTTIKVNGRIWVYVR